MALETTGLRYVAENFSEFLRNVNAVSSAGAKQENVFTRIAKSLSNTGNKYTDAGKAAQKFDDQIKKIGQEFVSQIPIIGRFSEALVAASGSAVLIAGGIGAAIAAIVALGVEGGRIRGVAASFDILTNSVDQLSTDVLARLREATLGTVADFELMRQTNIALAGATGEFGKQFAESLPEIFNLARIQAQATGQSVEYLVQSLVTGIKRASPLLIDNTGIVLKLGAANDALAQSLGKSVEALTSEEKQIAVLNAVMEAGKNITSLYGEQQVFANTKFAQLETTLTNIGDKIKVLFEPLASAVLNTFNVIAGLVDVAVTNIISVLSPIFEVVLTISNAFMRVLAPAITFLTGVAQGLFSRIGAILETLLAPFQLVIEAFGHLGAAIISLATGPIGFVLDFIGRAVDFIIGLVRDFLKAGALLIGALAAGMLRAANTILIPAVLKIATFIADFLVGASPPPKGPLSQIDKGGAATMEAWLAGFVGVSLDPVIQVAAEVVAAMGPIANFTLEQVEQRIGQLDAALKPFEDRLNIVKAQFEALAPVTEAAFNTIDRQLDEAVKRLTAGDTAAVAQVRALDAQREALQGYVDAQKEAIDNATIQAAIARSQQARERVLLEIRQKELELLQEKDPLIKEQKEKEIKAAKEKAKGGGEGAGAIGAGGFGATLPAPRERTFIDDLRDSFTTGFEFGGGEEELAKFGEGAGQVKAQFDRIAGAPLFKGIQEKLAEFGKLFDPTNPDSIGAKFAEFAAFHTDYNQPQGLVGFFHNLPNAIGAAVYNLGGIIYNKVVSPILATLENALNPAIAGSPAQLWDNFWSGDGDGTLTGAITYAQDSLSTKLTELNTNLTTWVNGLFDASVEGSLAYYWQNFWAGTGPGSITFFLNTASATITELLNGISADMTKRVNDLFDPAFEGSLAWHWNNFWGTILPGILNGFGAWIEENLSKSWKNAFNTVIAAIESFINNTLIKAFQEIAKSIADFLQGLGDTSSDIYNTLRGFQTQQVNFPRLARGGIFGGGMFKAGERGPEIGMSAQPFAMFSNKFVRAVDLFADTVFARPVSTPVGAGSTYNNQTYDQSVNATFNGQTDSGDVMRQLARLRSYR